MKRSVRINSRNIVFLSACAALALGGCGLLQGKIGIKIGSSGSSGGSRATQQSPRSGTAQGNNENRSGGGGGSTPAVRQRRVAAITTGSAGGLTPWSERQAGRFDGAECGEVLLKLGYELRGRRRSSGLKDAKPREQILLAVCSRRTYAKKHYKKLFAQQAKVASIGLGEYHATLDDRNPDPIAVALSVYWIGELIQVRANNLNAPIPRTLWQQTDRTYRAAIGTQKLAIFTGLANLYSGLVDDAAVSQAVEKLGLPTGAAQAMVRQFNGAKTLISAHIAKLSPAEQLLFVKLPAKVRADRKKILKMLAPLYARMDSLIAAGGVSDAKTLKEAEDIRVKFFKTCKNCDPMEHELFVETTKAITVWHLKQKDGFTAEAEWKRFRGRDSFKHTLPHAIYKATAVLGKKMDAALAERQRAEKAGVKLKTGTGGNTTPPLWFREGNQIRLSWEHPDVTRILAGRKSYSPFKAKVASVKRSGSKSKITFVKKKVTWEEEYACRRTNRVSRVTRDGHVQYEENCRYRKRSEMRPTHDPIELPAVEAKLIRGGDEIQGIWDRNSKEGRLQSASRRGKRVAYRTSSL